MSRSAFEAYNMLGAMRLHFTSKQYDFVKYKGKNKAYPDTIAAFNKFCERPDKIFYQKLIEQVKITDLQGFLTANFVRHSPHVTDLLSVAARTTYKSWLARQSNAKYVHLQRLKSLVDQHVAFMEADVICQLFIDKEIEPELAAVLLAAFYEDGIISPNPVIEKTSMRLIKYASLITYTKKDLKAALISAMASK